MYCQGGKGVQQIVASSRMRGQPIFTFPQENTTLLTLAMRIATHFLYPIAGLRIISRSGAEGRIGAFLFFHMHLYLIYLIGPRTTKSSSTSVTPKRGTSCKKRFKVFVVAQEYELQTQAQIVSALSVVHNFIRIYDPQDVDDGGDESYNVDDANPGNLQENITAAERSRATDRRDNIAKAMWADYRQRSQRR